jgi:hypothetical protein
MSPCSNSSRNASYYERQFQWFSSDAHSELREGILKYDKNASFRILCNSAFINASKFEVMQSRTVVFNTFLSFTPRYNFLST